MFGFEKLVDGFLEVVMMIYAVRVLQSVMMIYGVMVGWGYV
jgi:hypothetical protein